MKIVNICLCGSYNYGWGYQENLLTKYQRIIGNDVTIITSRFINDKNGEEYLEVPAEIKFDNGVKVIRLEHGIGSKLTKSFRVYKDLYHALEEEKPDFIFIHGCQFLDINKVCKYLKENPNVKCSVDNHADYTNSAQSVLAKLVHKTLWKYCAKRIDKFAEYFYGVLPIRCDFLNEMYGINRNRIKLLVMGADDEMVEYGISKKVETREFLGTIDDFVIITGGKIDLHKKETLELMKAVNKINNPNIKLLVFGSVVDELKEEFDSLLSDSIIYLGWIDQKEQYKYICASDLAIYPGRHSVIWEQTIGCGVPSMFKYLPNTQHVDIGGNCIFLKDCSEKSLQDAILGLCSDKEKYNKMKKTSQELGVKVFSYRNIARESISNCDNNQEKCIVKNGI